MDRGDARAEETVLIVTPSANDSDIAAEVLQEAGISAIACRDIHELCRRLESNYGVVMIAEESLARNEIPLIQRALENQEPWSDLPILLLTNAAVYRTTEVFSKSGNISLLERPFSRLTLIRAVEVALRGRRKQYQTRELLSALKSAKDESERANMAKTQFLAHMSHEIRTPIGAILGFTDLLKNPDNEAADSARYMNIVERNSHHLMRLIDDILDLSKVESGKMAIENIRMDLTDILADLLSVMSFKAQEKGITFDVRLNSLIPEYVVSDPVRLRQIVTNIIGNAIKFTERGEVCVDIEYAEPNLRFYVRDTGPGISESQRHKLFQAFSQADSSTTRKFGGTGLGLILSRRLAEAMDGKVELAASVLNQGSAFTIEVRAPKTDDSRLVASEAIALSTSTRHLRPSSLDGMKILLVEDSLDNQALVEAYLSTTGADLKTASNGAHGVSMALAEEFDVVLMDIQMPLMDGHAATAELRSSRYAKPVIALTAHAMAEEKNRCFATGFTDFLAKPIQRETLIQTLERYHHPCA